jgi:hypothetical protein
MRCTFMTVPDQISPGKSWRPHEIQILLKDYPTECRSLILRRLPGRSWQAIVEKVRDIPELYRKIRRPRDLSDVSTPLIAQLIILRERRGWTRRRLANITGYSAANIKNWELEQTRPRFRNLTDWCSALGVELTVTPIPRPPTLDPQHETFDQRQSPSST